MVDVFTKMEKWNGVYVMQKFRKEGRRNEIKEGEWARRRCKRLEVVIILF